MRLQQLAGGGVALICSCHVSSLSRIALRAQAGQHPCEQRGIRERQQQREVEAEQEPQARDRLRRGLQRRVAQAVEAAEAGEMGTGARLSLERPA